jgi:hypothetical protein
LGFGSSTAPPTVTRQQSSLTRTFPELELVKDRRFTGGIETDHQDPHLFLAELYYSKQRGGAVMVVS